ncbi:MAG: BrnT family toxin [Candidatus Marinimicrobia bacterium]|nr:BrnT family toxin [Candidatus Neomarinimicrobiota bacterium]MCH7764522.1 BrnT family toxin [Candidatus Neomarinimicrobiota bacterium]
MKYCKWNVEKNEILQKERGISFEMVIYLIETKNVPDIYHHPNQEKYPDQKIYVIEFEDYAYLVPFVEEDDVIFLKTIIPSRKATNKYLKRGK